MPQLIKLIVISENNCYETIPIRLNQLQRNFVSLYRISELSIKSLLLSDVVINIALYARPQAISELDNTQFLITANESKKYEFLDRVCARIGSHTINGIRCNATHKPEAAWSRCQQRREVVVASPIPGQRVIRFQLGGRRADMEHRFSRLSQHGTHKHLHGLRA